ncbi:hypothetical protein [Thalassobacillus sp. B23F22_16]|uniref:hypothetical protein n=1 Tax=Thalassobacillus sp. B23F22_16 TaxID=3459513 RepID=UPI00373EDBAE
MSVLIGGIVGLLMGVILEDPLKKVWKKITRRFKLLFVKRKEIIDPYYFSLGNLITKFLVYDGDGEMTYSQQNLETRLNNSMIKLPPDLKKLKENFARKEDEKEKRGEKFSWNGPVLGLERFQITRSKLNEDMKVMFTFLPSDYYTFKALNSQLDTVLPDGKTVREKYILSHQDNEPIPYLSNAFGVGLVVITKDKQVILTKRSPDSGVRPGEMDISIIEGVHPFQDKDNYSQGPDLFNTAIRGAKEELGLTIKSSNIKYLGFGLDKEYYQWIILGVIHINESSEEIIKRRTRGISGKWEITSLIFKPFTIDSIVNVIKNEKMWSTAKIALYWALIYEFPNRNVDKRISKAFK